MIFGSALKYGNFMEKLLIQYRFILDDNRREVFDLEIDRQTLIRIATEYKELPPWTALDFHQCPNCPLELKTSPSCPVAKSLSTVIARFEDVYSFEELDLEVVTSQRKVTQRTTAQRALGSFLGLLFATSGCPHTDYFKPMARFHLPLATVEDTIYRMAGMYLMAQYFRYSAGLDYDIDLASIENIFRDTRIVNKTITERIRHATEADSSLNAVIQLDAVLGLLPYISDDQLKDLEQLFKAYLA